MTTMPSSTSTTSLQAVSIDPSRLKNAFDILNQIDCLQQNDIRTAPNSQSTTSSPKKNISSSSNSRIISTPALEAIRSSRINGRSKSSSSKRLKSELRTKLNPQGKVNPGSQIDFLGRLETFKLSSYPAGKPRGLSPPSMAAHGWTNAQKNRLKCVCCGATWVLATPSKGDWGSSSGAQLVTLGIRMRTEQHRSSCPWRSRSCPHSIYHTPRWKSSRETFEALIKVAVEISDALFSNARAVFQVQHNLPDRVVTTLSIALQTENSSGSTLPSRSCPTTDALILALFGWSIKRVPAGRRDSSHSMAALPSIQGSNPASGRSTTLPESDDLPSLHCRLCHRQALPSPTSTKAFNPVHEHREYCPFIDPHAGFDPPQGPSAAADSRPGWHARLEAIQNVLDRQNFSICPSSSSSDNLHPLPNQSYVTLENIARHFNTRPPVTPSDHPLGSENTHTPVNPSRDSCPQINLLNFVKEVLVGPPSQLLSSV
ncbi:hypothetical protein PGT21_018074 [Puccinia graminis f. sp. tritici]|uniref:C3HC-type domain-containing protein n=2 Tax=Puccinia graminis f. sp. tritici TaxID=56615 RepID=A0A5B0QIC4_PUCGR|nr:hypothetical protein PGT21_018074 [Puccinia graminis f. sp. tritici]